MTGGVVGLGFAVGWVGVLVGLPPPVTGDGLFTEGALDTDGLGDATGVPEGDVGIGVPVKLQGLMPINCRNLKKSLNKNWKNLLKNPPLWKCVFQ